MEALWDYTNTVYEIVDLFLNALLVMLFYRQYLRNRSRTLAVGMAYFLAMAVLYLMPYNMQAVFAYGLGIIAVYLASTAFDQKEDLPQKVFLAVTIYLLKWIASGVTIIPWNLISSLTFANPKLALAPGRQYGWFVFALICNAFIENGILLFETMAVNRVYKGKRERMHWKELGLLISPYLAIVMGCWFSSFLTDAYERDIRQYIWSSHSEYRWIKTAFQIISFGAVITVIWSYEETRKAREELWQRTLISRETEDMKSHIGSVEKYYQDVRGMCHDLNNHLMVLSNLIRQEKWEEAVQYLEALQEADSMVELDVKTGNPVTDIILSEKKHEAEADGVEFTSYFQFPGNGNIEIFDVCIVISNALQNALEAAKGSKNPYIRVLSKMKNNAFLIIVQNSYEGALVIDSESGFPISDKEDRESHGFGIRNMKKVAEKYYGMIDIIQTGKEVELTVMMITG